jgi:hypothetical protein
MAMGRRCNTAGSSSISPVNGLISLPKFSGPNQPSGNGIVVGFGVSSGSDVVALLVDVGGGGDSLGSIVGCSVTALDVGSVVAGTSSRTTASVGISVATAVVGAEDMVDDSPSDVQAARKRVSSNTRVGTRFCLQIFIVDTPYVSSLVGLVHASMTIVHEAYCHYQLIAQRSPVRSLA